MAPWLHEDNSNKIINIGIHWPIYRPYIGQYLSKKNSNICIFFLNVSAHEVLNDKSTMIDNTLHS